MTQDEQDTRFDEFLRQRAQDYRPPPPTPRAELWLRIEAARRAARAGEKTPWVRPLHPRFPVRALAWTAAAAAVLVLGIGIGRLSVNGGGEDVPGAVTSATAVPGEALAKGGSAGQTLAYEVTAVQHFARIDGLLVDLKTRGAGDDVTRLARELLTSTRLLLDSPRLTDLRLRTLLQDLELMLAQIATLNPESRPEDLDFVSEGLARTELRSRLRNAIPSGPVTSM